MAKRDLEKLSKVLRGGAKTNPGKGAAIEPAPTLVIKFQKVLIKEVVNPFWQSVDRILIPVLARYESQYIKNDAMADAIGQALKELEAQWGQIGPQAVNLSTVWADQNSDYHREEFLRFLTDNIGVKASALLTDVKLEKSLTRAIEENAKLITSIPAKDVERITKVIADGLKSGNDLRSFRKEFAQIKGIDENRARLIARDQTSKLNGDLNRVRQIDVGITHYFWRCSGDGPPWVRPTHWANNNKRFSWASAPAVTGHPSHDVNCRCYADPDLRQLRI